MHRDGVDGPWSSFAIQVGTPPQRSRLFASTRAATFWIPVPEGCTQNDPSDCDDSRGFVFSFNDSTTFDYKGLYELELYEEKKLGLSGNGVYGFDTITLGWPGYNGPTVDDQLIAGIATKDFYIGALPLTPWPTNFTDLNNPIPSFMTTLKENGSIPSISWGYTAGSFYNAPQVFGSLTLGGYDAARIDTSKQNLSFPMGSDVSREHLVAVQGISIQSKDGQQELATPSDGIFANLNTNVAGMWLPQSVCNQFAEAFGLTYNKTAGLYLINDTQHDALTASNPAITFQLSTSLQSSDSVEITIPYSSLALQAKSPFLKKATGGEARYLPIHVAANSTAFTIGRVLFQHMYVITDYERSNFTIAPALLPGDTNPVTQLVAIRPTTFETKKPSSGLSGGAIAGIVIGVLAALIAIGLAFWFIRRKRQQDLAEEDGLDSGVGGHTADVMADGIVYPKHEMDATEQVVGKDGRRKNGPYSEIPTEDGMVGELATDAALNELPSHRTGGHEKGVLDEPIEGVPVGVFEMDGGFTGSALGTPNETPGVTRTGSPATTDGKNLPPPPPPPPQVFSGALPTQWVERPQLQYQQMFEEQVAARPPQPVELHDEEYVDTWGSSAGRSLPPSGMSSVDSPTTPTTPGTRSFPSDTRKTRPSPLVEAARPVEQRPAQYSDDEVEDH